MFSLTLLLGGLLLILVIGAMLAVFLLNRSWGSSLDSAPRLDASRPPAPSAGPALTGDVRADALALLAAGRKIEAIKRVRELTGLGLKEAKDYVDALERGLAVETPALSAAGAWEVAPPELDAELRALVIDGRKLEAIKLLRERSGLGLKEAKDYVDTLG